MVGIFNGDYASLTFDQTDSAKGKADDDAIIKGIVANPKIMRQMPRLLREVGLELVSVFPYVLAEVGEADFWTSRIEAYRRLAVRSGMMTEEYANQWATGLHKDSADRVFFGACNYYAYVARRA